MFTVFFLLLLSILIKKLQDLNDELILEVEKLKKELKGVPKSDDAVFDLKKKQKIDNSSWNEGATERKSHKKRHSVVTIFEERANQSETCNILHNLGTSSSNHLSSSDQMKGQSCYSRCCYFC